MNQGSSRPPVLPQTVEELCSFWDREFLELAYWTLLGRAPDAPGEAHFLSDLRTGESKLSILLRIRQSAEGRSCDPQLPGLDRALREYRRATRRYSGWIVRLFTGWEGNSGPERLQRAIANHFAAVTGLREDSPKPANGIRLGVVTESLDERVAVAAADAAALDQLRLRMVRIEASLKRIEARTAPSVAAAGRPVARKL